MLIPDIETKLKALVMIDVQETFSTAAETESTLIQDSPKNLSAAVM